MESLFDVPFPAFADMFNRMIPALENRLQNPIDGRYWGYKPLAIPGCYRQLESLYDAITCYGMLLQKVGRLTEGDRFTALGGRAWPDDDKEYNMLYDSIQRMRTLLEAHIPGVRNALKRKLPKKSNDNFWEIVAILFLLNAVMALDTLRDSPACQTIDGAAVKADKSNNLPRIRRLAMNTTSSPPAGTFKIEAFKQGALYKAIDMLDNIVQSREVMEMVGVSYALELTSRMPIPPGAVGAKLDHLRAKLAHAATGPRTTNANVAALERLAASAGAVPRSAARSSSLSEEAAAVYAEIMASVASGKRGGARKSRRRRCHRRKPKTQKNRHHQGF